MFVLEILIVGYSSLPQLRQHAKDSYRQVTELLDNLPSPPSENPAAELVRLITTFTAEVENVIQGRESHEYLLQKCRPAYRAFKMDIRSTAPRMRPYLSAMDDDHSATFDVEDDTPLSSDESVLPEPMYLPDVHDHIERYEPRRHPELLADRLI